MAFQLKTISNHNFQFLNDFFSGKETNGTLIENSETISDAQVTMNLNEWYFDGIRIAYSDLRFQKPADLEWVYEIKSDLITFQANIHGSVFVANQSHHDRIFGNYEHNLFSSSAGATSSGYLRPDRLRASMFFIQFRKDLFLRITSNGNESLDRFGKNVRAGNPSILSACNLPLTAQMLNTIQNIMHCVYKDGLKRMYLLSKSIEFLVQQAEASERAINPAYTYIKTKYDEARIFDAREYVMTHLEEPPTLPELARIVGINEYKLKRGFKEVFGNTVFGYVSEARLELAKTYLQDGSKSISQIASDLGYSSLPHFSSAFRKKYGSSPRKIKP